MKTAFVTGATGFLGRNLIECLTADAWEVVAYDRVAPPGGATSSPAVRYTIGDITDADACARAMPEGVDAVFHVAGNTSHWRLGDAQQTRDNVLGTRTLVETAFTRGARRFIHTSSIAAYGFQSGRITEDSVSTAEHSFINYFRTKRLAEREVEAGIERGLDAVILNPANIMGPYDASGWARLFVQIQSGQLRAAPPGSGSFCHVREVARTHVAAVERGRCGEHYLLGGADATFLELMQEMARLLDRSIRASPTPAVLLKTAGRIALWASYLTRREPVITPEKAALSCADLLCSSAKAERELGYRPVPLRTMVADSFDWLTRAGLLIKR